MGRSLVILGLALVVAGLLAIVSSASAQTSYGPVVSPGFGFDGYGGFGYHSSTLEEGVLRGLGDLTRSVGQANYLNSLASINQQEAVSRYIDNRQKYAETFFEMRQLNRAAREAERAQPLSTEQYVQLARAQAPNRLNEAEYDRVLGRVQAGGIATTDFESIPPSLRFFAGGDQSVRGYDYQSLSPKNNQGDRIGGRYLVAGSAEYQYSIAEKWRLATFVDQGNSFNSLEFPSLKTGVGIGVRWVSPVGPLRLDLARALDDDGGFRLHFSMGPEL